MVFPQSLEDFAASCEKVFGRKPIYVSLPEADTDVPVEAWCLALMADGYERLGHLGSGKTLLKQIEGTGFDFERLVCDQYRAGTTPRQLEMFHNVSRTGIGNIIRKHERRDE